MLSKLAISRYDPLLVLQHVHDYLQCQNRYNISVLPSMKLKNKLADMCRGGSRIFERRGGGIIGLQAKKGVQEGVQLSAQC